MDNIRLSNNNMLPVVGFGTYLINKKDTIKSVVAAIENGYRHIDTAQAYENEEEVGYAVRQCIVKGIVKREDLFITSKLSSHNRIGYQEAKDAIKSSLLKMDLEYIDCYLIHWPNVAPGAMWKNLNAETWRGFEECYENGLVKNLGVSNFMIHHLEELLKTAAIKPVINQIHLSPIWQQKEVVKWCKENGIQCVAWSPLVRFVDWAGLFLQNPDYGKADDWTAEIMDTLSEKYCKSKPQIALRWSLQKGFVPITKSTHPARIKENIDIFDFNISDSDMEKLDSLNARPSNPDATPDSIYNSWSMSVGGGLRNELINSKSYFLGLPLLRFKRVTPEISKYYLLYIPLLKVKKANNKITYYLFHVLPLLKVKQRNETTKYYLFKLIPVIKRIQKGNAYHYYLGGKIKFAKKVENYRKQQISFLPNYQDILNKTSLCAPLSVPKWNPFKVVLFNGYDNYTDYMPEGNKKLFKLYLFLRFLFTKKVTLPTLIYRVTSNCTLRCKECCAFTPYYKLNNMASFETFKRDLDKILESVDQIYYLNLFGGEPLLNQELDKMIAYANTKKQIKKVFFTTNGTIIPSENVMNAIKQKKDNFIYISDYRENKSIDILKQNEIVSLLQKNNVPYFHIRHDFVSGWTLNPQNREDVVKMKWKYFYCFEKNARLAEDGKYYCCTVARIMDVTKQYHIDETHYIDLTSKKDLRKDFIDFFKRDHFKVCEVCDFNRAGHLRFPAIQLKDEQ